MSTTTEVLATAEDKMNKAVANLLKEFQTVRTGRANPGLLDRVEVEYPVGHRRRRAEAVPLLRVKFAGALATRMPAGRADPIRRLFEDPDRLDATPVGDLVGMFVA